MLSRRRRSQSPREPHASSPRPAHRKFLHRLAVQRVQNLRTVERHVANRVAVTSYKQILVMSSSLGFSLLKLSTISSASDFADLVIVESAARFSVRSIPPAPCASATVATQTLLVKFVEHDLRDVVCRVQPYEIEQRRAAPSDGRIPASSNYQYPR